MFYAKEESWKKIVDRWSKIGIVPRKLDDGVSAFDVAISDEPKEYCFTHYELATVLRDKVIEQQEKIQQLEKKLESISGYLASKELQQSMLSRIVKLENVLDN